MKPPKNLCCSILLFILLGRVLFFLSNVLIYNISYILIIIIERPQARPGAGSQQAFCKKASCCRRRDGGKYR